jgi:hypothetical protein
MDPYLEQPWLWPDVHNSLIAALRDDLAPQLRPRYYAAIEERTYTGEPGDLVVAGRADVAVVRPAVVRETNESVLLNDGAGGVVVDIALPDVLRETYLEVRSTDTGQVVTVVEILSPSNKRPGEGREQYMRKRNMITGTLTNLVEIDLLRYGEPMPVQRWSGRSDYRIVISRGRYRPKSLLIPFNVRQPIPSFRLPLVPGDTEPTVDLNRLLHALYERGSYDLRLNYRADPEPPMEPEDAAWAAQLLQDAGLR